MAESTCRYCKQKIKQFFPVNWCHTDTMNVYCYPNAKEGTRESNLIATPPDKPIKVYLVYEHDSCDKDVNNLKVFKNEDDAEKFRKEQPQEYGVSYHVQELEGEGF